MIDECVVCHLRTTLAYRKLCRLCYQAWKQTEVTYAFWLIKLPSRMPSALERLECEEMTDAYTHHMKRRLLTDLQRMQTTLNTKEMSLAESLRYGK